MLSFVVRAKNISIIYCRIIIVGGTECYLASRKKYYCSLENLPWKYNESRAHLIPLDVDKSKKLPPKSKI